MNNSEKIEDWLKRSNSNLARAEAGKVSSEVLYEDLCFDIQQAVEKVFKALCIKEGIDFPRTHNIEFLIEKLEKKGVKIPENIKKAKMLTEYAVETRYPGDYDPVEEDEYKEMLKIGQDVIKWIKKVINSNHDPNNNQLDLPLK